MNTECTLLFSLAQVHFAKQIISKPPIANHKISWIVQKKSWKGVAGAFVEHQHLFKFVSPLLWTLSTLFTHCQLFVLFSWSIPGARLASVQVLLTNPKMENAQIHTQIHRSGYRVRPGLNIPKIVAFLICSAGRTYFARNKILEELSQPSVRDCSKILVKVG